MSTRTLFVRPVGRLEPQMFSQRLHGADKVPEFFALARLNMRDDHAPIAALGAGQISSEGASAG
jgi:hypothetical protein